MLKKKYAIKVFVCIFSLSAFVQFSFENYFLAVLTTIEKRFHYSSTTSALIMSVEKIGALIVVPFVSFFGNRYSRPRIIANGLIIATVGLFITLMPHFINEPYQPRNVPHNNDTEVLDEELVCNSEMSRNFINSSILQTNEPTSDAYKLIIFGRFLVGVGAAPFYSLGIAYIDDNTDRHTSSMYIGIVQTVALIGPVCGFLVSSLILKCWVNFPAEAVVLDSDEDWVGAWWLGVAISVVLVFVTMLPFWLFDEKQRNKQRAKDNEEKLAGKIKLTTDLRELVVVTKRLFTNIFYLLVILTWILLSFEILGSTIFQVKYFEVMFKVSASYSTFLIGAAISPFLILGTLLGSLVIRLFKFEFNGAIRILIVCQVASAASYIFLMSISCAPTKIAGINHVYSNQNESDLISINNTCNYACGCDQNIFDPVCDITTSITYISPCYAGCKEEGIRSNGTLESYSSCSCAANFQNVTVGSCKTNRNCSYIVSVCLWAFIYLLSGFSAVPCLIILFKSVKASDKTYAIGIGIFFTGVCATIPSPIVMGIFIDKSCVLWNHQKANSEKYCLVYDTDQFRKNYFGVVLFIAFLSTFVTILTDYVGNKAIKKEDEKLKEKRIDEEHVDML